MEEYENGEITFCLTLEKYEELDTKWVIIINKSKKDRQHNAQKNKDKQRSTKQQIE